MLLPLIALFSPIYSCCDSASLTDCVDGRNSLPIVKTWNDLERQKPILLKDGVSIRLGIEAKDVSLGKGYLVYCLCNTKFTPSRKIFGQPLGPIFLSTGSETRKVGLRASRDTSNLSNKTRLYVCAVKGKRLGLHRVRLVDQKGNDLVAFSYRVTYDCYHPWSPFRSLFSSNLNSGSYAPRGGIALPSWDGSSAIPAPENQTHYKTKRLPTFVPQQQTGLQIRIQETKLIVTATSTRELLQSRPHARFLVRWWVNGKPALMNIDPFVWPRKSFRENDIRVRKIAFPIKVDLQRLKVVAGDRIGLQVLYSDRSCDADDIGLGDNVILVSNRLSFVAK